MEGLFFFLHRIHGTAELGAASQPGSPALLACQPPCLPACCHPSHSLAVGAVLVVGDVQNVARGRLVEGIATTALDCAVRQRALLRYMLGVGRTARPGCSHWGNRQAGALHQTAFHPLVCSQLDKGVVWVGLHIAELGEGEGAPRALSGTRQIVYVAGQLLHALVDQGFVNHSQVASAMHHCSPQAGIATAAGGDCGWRWPVAPAPGHLQLLDGIVLLLLNQSDKIRCVQPLPLSCKFLMVEWFVVCDLPELVDQVAQGLHLRA